MEAMLYTKISANKVKCHVCNHYCEIDNGKRGICGVRENVDGTLFALNYGKTIASHIDPIEKKPLYHFMPNTMTYSLATVGCNMKCLWCQNHSISQAPKPNKKIAGTEISSKEHVKIAKKYFCPSISYTYTEPTIYLEYALEIMKEATKEGIKNIWVSNGFMSKEALELIMPFLDAVNIDYKGSNNVYQQFCLGKADYVLENLKSFIEAKIHLEITTLIIPGVNDKEEDIINIIDDIIEYVGIETPWHISRFFPNFMMLDNEITPLKTLENAKKLGTEKGLKYIYIGNV